MGQDTAIDLYAINFYENLVISHLTEEAAPKAEITDKNLLEDITCLALNMLPPRYIRHSVDMAFFLSDDEHKQMKAAASQAVDSAIQIAVTNANQASRK